MGTTTRWQFLRWAYVPDVPAWEAYGAHTRRDPGPMIRNQQEEELVLFFEADGFGLPKASVGDIGYGGLHPHRGEGSSGEAARGLARAFRGGGVPGSEGLLHALLPTRLGLPLSAHMHGPWLLSVDRQDVQSLEVRMCSGSHIPLG